ncbi:hypothetical protein [Pseudoalteromonas distincta]|uniref:hypothetical protein n=1 Tax=Pseudoalteromonas distincta TaxID=77608 RepID=UPI0034E89A63
MFNRTAVHRASPNRNEIQRRVLKISFQSKDTIMPACDPSIKSHEKRINMLKVQQLVPKKSVLLRSLLGDKNIGDAEIKQALQEKINGESIQVLNTNAKYKIECKMNVLQEFRGYAKDLVFIKNLIIYNIFSRKTRRSL